MISTMAITQLGGLGKVQLTTGVGRRWSFALIGIQPGKSSNPHRCQPTWILAFRKNS